MIVDHPIPRAPTKKHKKRRFHLLLPLKEQGRLPADDSLHLYPGVPYFLHSLSQTDRAIRVKMRLENGRHSSK